MGVCADRWSYPAGWLGRAGCALRVVRGSSTRNTTYNSSRARVWLRDTAVIEWPLSSGNACPQGGRHHGPGERFSDADLGVAVRSRGVPSLSVRAYRNFPHWAGGASGCSVGPASAKLSRVVETYIVESGVPVLGRGGTRHAATVSLHQTETRGIWASYCSGARCSGRFLAAVSAPVAVAGDRGGDCVGAV